jgi:hypothetical protein
MIMLAISAVIMGVFWKKIFNRNSIYLPFIIGGAALFITYPGIVKILPGVIASISGDHSGTAIFVFAVLLAVLGYGVYYSVKNDKRTMHLAFMSVIFILLGFTTYTMIIIRSNQNPPMNENEPNDFSELVSYLNRDQYGDFPIFMRRFASEPHQQGVYTNYDSDLDFWWRYQMNHMTTRYWLWNFAGRESWAQDAGPDIAPFNSIGNFLGKAFSIHFSGDSTNSLYCIPFLIGLIGIYFHFRKDWKMAAIFMVLFIFMGYLTAFYQNQQQPQPRERDYFYVGAFFVYGIWIAIGMRGLVGLVQEKLSKTNFAKPAIFGVLALGIVFIPFNMLKTNYHTHNRSINWVPWDYSYNILQSCAPNAVLFTNGDNDTFPLWYLQDVEGVRRDVKIVCLSLANTPWYIRELKNNDPYNVGTIEIRLSDQQIDRIGAVQWKSQNITLPIPQDINTDRMDIQDSSLIKSGSLTFTMNSTLDFGNIKAVRVQDLIVKEIIEANNWQRPIYFASTTSVNSKIGLNNLLKLEGMASRLVPENKRRSADFINLPALTKGLLQENNSYNKNFERGFKFRGLHKGDMFINDNQARMLQNYRNAFLKLAFYYVDNNQRQQAIAVMDSMMSKINKDIVLMDYDIYAEIGNVYLMAGATDKYKKIASEVEKEALQALEINSGDISAFRVLLGVYQNTNDYKNLLKTWKKLQKLYPNDPNVRQNVLKYQQLTDSLKQ